MANNNLTNVITEKNAKIDLLDRNSFLNRMLTVTEILSNNKKNVCYALNGSWGIGKSFVLDMFEKQIGEIQSEDTNSDKYFLFHYNCWQYDYYEEPLIAIVSSMLDQIDEKENLFSTETKTRLKSALKVIGNGLISKASQIVEEKTGIDLQEVIDAIKESNKKALEAMAERNEYDSYFTFKKTLQALRETIKSLAKEKTLIFVVDELDRCLPEYSIKVLERLHHIFDDVPNVQMILSIDKSQFENTIYKIYGEKTAVDKYLAKFIDFEMNLDEGMLNNEFDNRFAYYFDKFTCLSVATHKIEISTFKKRIFDGIDMRSKIEIIEKCNLMHSLLNPEEEQTDYVFMCIEIAFAVMKYWGVDLNANKPAFLSKKVFDAPKNSGLNFLNRKYVEGEKSGFSYYYIFRNSDYINANDIFGAILECYRYVVGYTNDHIDDNSYRDLDLRAYSKRFRNLLYIIG